MGFTISKNSTREGVSYTTNKRIYATKDGRVVEEGHPDALILLAGAGGQIDEKTAKRLCLTEKGQQLPEQGPLMSSVGELPESPPRGSSIEREPGMGAGPAVQTVKKMTGGPGRPLGSGKRA